MVVAVKPVVDPKKDKEAAKKPTGKKKGAPVEEEEPFVAYREAVPAVCLPIEVCLYIM